MNNHHRKFSTINANDNKVLEKLKTSTKLTKLKLNLNKQICLSKLDNNKQIQIETEIEDSTREVRRFFHQRSKTPTFPIANNNIEISNTRTNRSKIKINFNNIYPIGKKLPERFISCANTPKNISPKEQNKYKSMKVEHGQIPVTPPVKKFSEIKVNEKLHSPINAGNNGNSGNNGSNSPFSPTSGKFNNDKIKSKIVSAVSTASNKNQNNILFKNKIEFKNEIETKLNSLNPKNHSNSSSLEKKILSSEKSAKNVINNIFCKQIQINNYTNSNVNHKSKDKDYKDNFKPFKAKPAPIFAKKDIIKDNIKENKKDTSKSKNNSKSPKSPIPVKKGLKPSKLIAKKKPDDLIIDTDEDFTFRKENKDNNKDDYERMNTIESNTNTDISAETIVIPCIIKASSNEITKTSTNYVNKIIIDNHEYVKIYKFQKSYNKTIIKKRKRSNDFTIKVNDSNPSPNFSKRKDKPKICSEIKAFLIK